MALAPLAQTLLITPSRTRKALSEQVTVPTTPATPTPSPSFSTQPTIASDGTPQVGELLTATDGTVANLGGNTLTRRWLLGSTVLATTLGYTPLQIGTFTFQNRVIAPNGTTVLATASVTVNVAAASTPTPTPTPSAPNAPVLSLPEDYVEGDSLIPVITVDETVAAGMRWDFEMATDELFTPQPPSNIVWTGDSQGGTFIAHWAAQHPDAPVKDFHVGGTGFSGPNSVLDRESSVIQHNPRIYIIQSFGNDLTSYASAQAAIDVLTAHVNRVRAKCPDVFVILGTLVASGIAGQGSYNTLFNTRRAQFNTLARGLVGTTLDAVYDLAANSSIGDDADMVPAAASSTTITVDGTHLYDDGDYSHATGAGVAYGIFNTAMTAALAATAGAPAGSVFRSRNRPITDADLRDGPAFDILAQQTAGPVSERLRIMTDILDEDGEYICSDWSNTLTAEVLEPPESASSYSNTEGPNRSTYQTSLTTENPDGPPFTKVRGPGQGYNTINCLTRTNNARGGNRQVQHTVTTTWPGGVYPDVQFGRDKGELAFGPGLKQTFPGKDNSDGYTFHMTGDQILGWANGGTEYEGPYGANQGVNNGDIFWDVTDEVAHTVKLYRKRGGGAPTLICTMTVPAIDGPMYSFAGSGADNLQTAVFDSTQTRALDAGVLPFDNIA